jgi:hypothetical protein
MLDAEAISSSRRDALRGARRAKRFNSTTFLRYDRRHVEICDASSIRVIEGGDPARDRATVRTMSRVFTEESMRAACLLGISATSPERGSAAG